MPQSAFSSTSSLSDCNKALIHAVWSGNSVFTWFYSSWGTLCHSPLESKAVEKAKKIDEKKKAAEKEPVLKKQKQ